MNLIKRHIIKLFQLVLIIYFALSCKKEDENNDLSYNVISPSSGEVWLTGNSYNIEWIDENSTEVRVKLFKAEEKIMDIVSAYSNSGSFKWIIPDSMEYGNDYRIMVYSNNNDFVRYGNQEPFTIVPPSETSTYVDERDEKEYKIVKIGEQWWFAENFNYSIESGSHCYFDDTLNCLEQGGLYSIGGAFSLNPSGWHLPTDKDWMKLEYYLGLTGTELGSEEHRGNNAGLLLKENGGLEFNAKLSGYRYKRWSWYRYNGLNVEGRYWTSSAVSNEAGSYWYRSFSFTGKGIARKKLTNSQYWMSVRYVKDDD